MRSASADAADRAGRERCRANCQRNGIKWPIERNVQGIDESGPPKAHVFQFGVRSDNRAEAGGGERRTMWFRTERDERKINHRGFTLVARARAGWIAVGRRWEADARASATVDVPAPFVVASHARRRAARKDEELRENFEIVQVHHEAEMKRKEAMQTKVDQLGNRSRSLKARDVNESAGKYRRPTPSRTFDQPSINFKESTLRKGGVQRTRVVEMREHACEALSDDIAALKKKRDEEARKGQRAR